MTDQFAGVDPSEISAERFASLVSQATDEQVERAMRGVGIERTLDRIFQ